MKVNYCNIEPRSKMKAETAMARTKVDVLLATPLYNVPMRLMVTNVEFSDEKTVLKKKHGPLGLEKKWQSQTR